LTAVAEIVTFCAVPGANPTLDKLTESEKFGVLPDDVDDDEFNVAPQPHVNTGVMRRENQKSRTEFFGHKVITAFARRLR
jgi:hypothetical protein